MKKLSSRQEERAGDIAGTGRSSGEKPVLSEKLTRMLTAHRTAAIQAELMNRPEVALAALVHRLVMQVVGNRYRSGRIVQINVEETRLKPDAENIEQSRAGMAIEEKRQYWKDKVEAAEQEDKGLFAWLLDQSQ